MAVDLGGVPEASLSFWIRGYADTDGEILISDDGGQTYAEMGRFLDASGKPTNDENAAAINPQTKKPVENGLRNMWVNETALATALNTAYFAESVATFAIVMGIALLLAGLGFAVLSIKLLAPANEREGSRAKAGSAAVASV